MLSEKDIQLKADQYLRILQQAHSKKKQKLKELQARVNSSAIIIQRAWRRYIWKKKNRKAIIIQKAWKKYLLRLKQSRIKIQRFRRLFYAIKISNAIFQKFFPKKYQLTIEKKVNQNIKKKQQKISFTSNLQKYFYTYITKSQIFNIEAKYIKKLRVYQKSKFSQAWQKYEQNLRKQIQRQASKKWVQKDAQSWITQQEKQVNLQDYIQKHVQRLFKEEYKKYKQKDDKLQKNLQILQGKIRYFKEEYYYNMIKG